MIDFPPRFSDLGKKQVVGRGGGVKGLRDCLSWSFGWFWSDNQKRCIQMSFSFLKLKALI